MTVLKAAGFAHAPITEDEVKVKGALRPAIYTDEAALKMVVQDAATAEAWQAQEQWKLLWRETDILYQSPRTQSVFEGSSTPRSNVNRFTVAKHTNSLVPMMMSGIFYDPTPFLLRPRRAKQETVRGKTRLISVLLERGEFKEECEPGLLSQVLNGTGIWQKIWEVRERIEKRYVRKHAPGKVSLPLTGDEDVVTEESDEFEVEEVTIKESVPVLEYCPLGTVFPDPKWNRANQINKAKFVIKRRYLSFNKLNELRTKPGYNLPPEAELKSLFFGAGKEQASGEGIVKEQQFGSATVHHAEKQNAETTADPLEYDLKVDERWDRDKVITVVEDKLIIRNEEHMIGDNSFLSANWWDIQNAGFGIGIGRLIGADQRVEQGSINGALDMLAYALNQQYVVSRGANAFTQQVRSRLGGMIMVDGDVNKGIKTLETPKVPPEIWQVIQNAKDSSTSTSGADEAAVQGSLPGRGSSFGRTATGAGGIISANASRIQGPVGRFVDHVFVPFIQWVNEQIAERMPMSEIRDILRDEIDDDFVKNLDLDDFLNAKLDAEVLAGAHLAAKKAMAQSLPFIIQIFENPHMLDALQRTGWTIDIKELFDMLMEMSEWKNSREVIRKFSPDEAKAYAESQNAQQQGALQNDLTKIAAKHKATQEEIDQKREADLASKLSMDAVDRGHAEIQRMIVRDATKPGVEATQ